MSGARTEPAPSLRGVLLWTHWHHPEWVAVVVSAAGWAVLVALVVAPPTPGDGGVPAAVVVLAMSAAMAAGMMAPLALTAVHDVAVSSLWSRRYRAALGYLAGFLGVWTLVGVAATAAGRVLATGVGTTGALALTFGVAAVAPLAPGRRRRLALCEVVTPGALRGWSADRDCVRAGTAAGSWCTANCWALMTAVMVQHSVVVAVTATALTIAERRHPNLPPRVLAAAIVILGAVSALLLLAAGGGAGTAGVHAGH